MKLNGYSNPRSIGKLQSDSIIAQSANWRCLFLTIKIVLLNLVRARIGRLWTVVAEAEMLLLGARTQRSTNSMLRRLMKLRGRVCRRSIPSLVFGPIVTDDTGLPESVGIRFHLPRYAALILSVSSVHRAESDLRPAGLS